MRSHKIDPQALKNDNLLNASGQESGTNSKTADAAAIPYTRLSECHQLSRGLRSTDAAISTRISVLSQARERWTTSTQLQGTNAAIYLNLTFWWSHVRKRDDF